MGPQYDFILATEISASAEFPKSTSTFKLGRKPKEVWKAVLTKEWVRRPHLPPEKQKVIEQEYSGKNIHDLPDLFCQTG
jgi:hypothetical protein